MTRGDARLKMIFADVGTRSRFVEVKHPARDHRVIPQRPILLFESKQITFGILPCWNSRGIQEHQRKQGMRVRLVAGTVLRQ